MRMGGHFEKGSGVPVIAAYQLDLIITASVTPAAWGEECYDTHFCHGNFEKQKATRIIYCLGALQVNTNLI